MRVPLLAKPGKAKRYDTSSERNGVSNLFMFFEPLVGKRDIVVTEKRTAVEWARQVRDLVDKRCPEAERITLVMDNLNTHAFDRCIKHLSFNARVVFWKGLIFTEQKNMVAG